MQNMDVFKTSCRNPVKVINLTYLGLVLYPVRCLLELTNLPDDMRNLRRQKSELMENTTMEWWIDYSERQRRQKSFSPSSSWRS